MSNEYYSHTGWPDTSGSGQSVDARAELNALQAAFDKLPAMSGNGNKNVVVNAAGTALTIASAANVAATAWTPSISCATPGDLAITYSTRTGSRFSVGGMTMVTFEMVTSAFTHTTASGVVIISGWPVDSGHNPNPIGSLLFSGITKAGYTQFALRWAGTGVCYIGASGSAQALVDTQIADMPTAGTVKLLGMVVFA